MGLHRIKEEVSGQVRCESLQARHFSVKTPALIASRVLHRSVPLVQNSACNANTAMNRAVMHHITPLISLLLPVTTLIRQ